MVYVQPEGRTGYHFVFPFGGALEFFTHPLGLFSSLLSMRVSLVLRSSVFALLSSLCLATMTGQTPNPQPSAACPAQPSTLRAMRHCYHPLLVFAPAMDDPQLVEQFNQLKAHAAELRSRDLLYVPIVPEGHNQPIPGSRIHTASLSEDELAAMRHHFNVESGEFLVILIDRDGGEKLHSRTPVPVDQLKQLTAPMPPRKGETEPGPQGDE
jgi:hypothetical protein